MSKSNEKYLKSSEDYFYIKFYPGVMSSIGCEKATLILGRLEYWFSHQKFTSGFYKFIEPCGHPLYREGDSWSEELGFSRKVFARAFDLIGIRYKSKSAFLNSPDRFQGKLYASYHDRKTNRTYFIRNHAFAAQFIKQLFNRKNSSASLEKKAEKVQRREAIYEALVCVNGRSRNSQFSCSSGGTIGGKNNNSIQKHTSSLKTKNPESLSSSEPEQKKVTEEMIKIWKEEVGELGLSSISNQLLERLFLSLTEFFEKSLEKWKHYCQMIASSKFLMGEAQNKFFKKAWITWAIKKEAIERIRGGEFKLGDRETKLDAKIQNIHQELRSLEEKRNKIERSMEEIRLSTERERFKRVRDILKTFSQDQIDQFKPEFEKTLRAENNSITQEFNKGGWRSSFVQTYFDFFLEEKITRQLYATSIEEEAEKRIKELSLTDTLNAICQEKESLKKLEESLIKQRKAESLWKDLSQESLLAA